MSFSIAVFVLPVLYERPSADSGISDLRRSFTITSPRIALLTASERSVCLFQAGGEMFSGRTNLEILAALFVFGDFFQTERPAKEPRVFTAVKDVCVLAEMKRPSTALKIRISGFAMLAKKGKSDRNAGI